MIEHHITRLEVAIQEGVALLCSKILSHQSKVGFEFQFVKIELSSFEEAVLKVIEIKQHTILVELSLWVAIGEIQPHSASHLYVGQLTDSTSQQFLLLKGITTTSLSPATYGIKERHAT